MFCDLAGSTAMANRLDPEMHKEVVEGYYDIVADAVSTWGGHIGTYLGDGVLAFFGYPVSREDNTARAVLAGLQIQETIEGVNANGGVNGEAIAARVGIHVGLVVLDEMGVDSGHGIHAMGDAVNLAARIQDAAANGDVFVSAAAARLAGPGFEVEDRGECVLKGIDEPQRLFRVVDTDDRSAGDGSPDELAFVGRDAERGLLAARWELARAGQGETVVLRGDPGIGKSRLVRQVVRDLDPPLSYTVECSPYEANTPFAVARSLLEARLAEEPNAAGGDALAHALDAERGAEPEESRLLLQSFLDGDDTARSAALTPVEARHRVIERIAELIATPAGGAAAVVVVEDIQWADPSSLEVVAALLARIATSPVLVVLTARPDFETPWSDSSNRNTLWLTRLAEDEIRDLVSNAISRSGLSDDVIDAVIARTDGVPLFAEELTRHLQDQINDGDLIPDSLSDSLLARLDRLGNDRPVAQAAAVIGREFSAEEVSRVLGGDQDCAVALQRLEREDVVERVGAGVGRFRFRHALVQQAAYDSLLLRTRRQAHERLAEFLTDDGFAAEVIARHWTAAERPTEAAEQWRLAGDRAMRAAAHLEAAEHFAAAIDQLTLLPLSAERHHDEMDLQLKLAGACQFSKGFAAQEVQSAVSRAMALSELTGEPGDQVQTLYGALTTTTSSGQISAVDPIARRLSEAAEASGDPIDLATAHVGCGSAALNLARFEEVLERSRAALTLLEGYPRQAGTNAPLARLYGGLAAYQLGDIDALVELGDPLLEWGETPTDDPFGDLINTNMALILSKTLAPDERTVRLADRLREIAIDNGLDFMTVFADLYGGWARAMQGDVDGVAMVQRGLELQLATQQYLYLDDSFRSLAEAQLHNGDSLGGLESIGQAVRHVAQPHHEIHVYRVRAELLAALDADPADIDREYIRGRDVEPGVRMPVARLQLALSRARWMLARGDSSTARAVVDACRVDDMDPRLFDVVQARAVLEECGSA